MIRVRMIAVTTALMVSLLTGTGVASARLAWCGSGCPPPMEAGLAENPQHNPHGMPTPIFENANGKFVEAGDEVSAVDKKTGEVVSVQILLPPGMAGKVAE